MDIHTVYCHLHITSTMHYTFIATILSMGSANERRRYIVTYYRLLLAVPIPRMIFAL